MCDMLCHSVRKTLARRVSAVQLDNEVLSLVSGTRRANTHTHRRKKYTHCTSVCTTYM